MIGTTKMGMHSRRELQQGSTSIPTHVYMEFDITSYQAHDLAMEAVAIARRNMPKFTGQRSRELRPIWGAGFFGIMWDSPEIWYQEVGIRPFTMTKLAGKTIPMWIKDPTGVERQKNPKAETRVGEDGVVRVLIFRRAARQGQRKTVVRGGRTVDVPASYPGAPGRIGVREIGRGMTRDGKVAGRIAGGLDPARRNVGVRWRHPGLTGRSFLFRGMTQAALHGGLDQTAPVWATTNRWK